MTADDVSPVETCEVCIVGAGIAGLNALFVTSRYLARDQKVILIDRRQRVGGMWVDTYPYVRLHQPHPVFTAGNIKWTLDQDRGYLATKPEVLDHFEHCLNVIKQDVDVEEVAVMPADRMLVRRGIDDRDLDRVDLPVEHRHPTGAAVSASSARSISTPSSPSISASWTFTTSSRDVGTFLPT